MAIVTRLLERIRALPLGSRDGYFEDPRNAPAVESCLRRSLEALLDLGRHILAKAYGVGVSEYQEIAVGLGRCQALSPADAELLRTLADYRNRLVHCYHDVPEEELFTICSAKLNGLEQIWRAYLRWIGHHPEKLEQGV